MNRFEKRVFKLVCVRDFVFFFCNGRDFFERRAIVIVVIGEKNVVIF